MLLLLLEVHTLAAPEAAALSCAWLQLTGVLLPPRHMYLRLLELSQLHWLAAAAASCFCWLLLAAVLFSLFWLPLLAAAG